VDAWLCCNSPLVVSACARSTRHQWTRSDTWNPFWSSRVHGNLASRRFLAASTTGDDSTDPVASSSSSPSLVVTPLEMPPFAEIIGSGRIGDLLASAGACNVLGRGDTIDVTHQGCPIIIATRNDALDGIVAACPPERRADLVFVQNGYLDSFLEQHGLLDNTQALLYLSVPAKGVAPVDGVTRVNPHGLTAATGRHAAALAQRLAAVGMKCNVVEPSDYRPAMFEKLMYVVLGVCFCVCGFANDKRHSRAFSGNYFGLMRNCVCVWFVMAVGSVRTCWWGRPRDANPSDKPVANMLNWCDKSWRNSWRLSSKPKAANGPLRRDRTNGSRRIPKWWPISPVPSRNLNGAINTFTTWATKRVLCTMHCCGNAVIRDACPLNCHDIGMRNAAYSDCLDTAYRYYVYVPVYVCSCCEESLLAGVRVVALTFQMQHLINSSIYSVAGLQGSLQRHHATGNGSCRRHFRQCQSAFSRKIYSLADEKGARKRSVNTLSRKNDSIHCINGMLASRVKQLPLPFLFLTYLCVRDRPSVLKCMITFSSPRP
jgi:hypothetical protein